MMPYEDWGKGTMIEVPLSELRGADVGCRVVVTRDGNAFDGLLTDFWVTRSDYDIKDRPKITARLTVKTASCKLELTSLPLDYLIQIERPIPDAAPPKENE